MSKMTFLQRASGVLYLLAAAGFAPAAQAHVTLEWPAALAGSHHKAAFRIGHGCGASPTRQVIVEIPAGVRGARPQPHAGWSVEIQRAPLTQPYVNHGRTITDDVVRITWTARSREDMLENAHFDEFALLAQMPQAAGPLYWPVRQVCVEGRLDWVQVPTGHQKPADLSAPAVLLDILPSGGAGGHSH